MNTRPVEAEFHSDGQTEGQTAMTELIVAFRNFVNLPETQSVSGVMEIRAVCSDVLTKHISIKVDFLTLAHLGTRSNHWTMQG